MIFMTTHQPSNESQRWKSSAMQERPKFGPDYAGYTDEKNRYVQMGFVILKIQHSQVQV